jgi:hypothetical protein
VGADLAPLENPPSGNGDWGTGSQSVKDRWVFCVRPDDQGAQLLIDDLAAIRHWQQGATDHERAWAKRSINLRGVA